MWNKHLVRSHLRTQTWPYLFVTTVHSLYNQNRYNCKPLLTYLTVTTVKRNYTHFLKPCFMFVITVTYLFVFRTTCVMLTRWTTPTRRTTWATRCRRSRRARPTSFNCLPPVIGKAGRKRGPPTKLLKLHREMVKTKIWN